MRHLTRFRFTMITKFPLAQNYSAWAPYFASLTPIHTLTINFFDYELSQSEEEFLSKCKKICLEYGFITSLELQPKGIGIAKNKLFEVMKAGRESRLCVSDIADVKLRQEAEDFLEDREVCLVQIYHACLSSFIHLCCRHLTYSHPHQHNLIAHFIDRLQTPVHTFTHPPFSFSLISLETHSYTHNLSHADTAYHRPCWLCRWICVL